MGRLERKSRQPRDMRRRLITPEGIDLGLVLGEAGQRASAFIVDAIIILVALIGMTLIAIFGLVGLGIAAAQSLGVIWLLGWFLLRNFYFISFELRPRAATPGKRLLGLRVVARDGGRLTADAVIARNLVREIEIFLPLTFLATGRGEGAVEAWTVLLGLGWTALFLFFPLFNRDRLRIGDMLAGTWVVRTSKRKLGIDLAAFHVEAPAAYQFSDEQLDHYGVFELQKLEEVLLRDNYEARWTVTASIRARIGWSGPIDDSHAFLVAYYSALRDRLERRLLLGHRRRDKHDMECR
jgi:uncharacterized RDD family membrane protein YckC